MTARRAGRLERRLAALEDALRVAGGRLEGEDVDDATAVVMRAGRRIRLGTELTVAALAGATGSGKSSLFNELAGHELSSVGVLRPTTATLHACVWGSDDATALLDWLGVARRHRLDREHRPNGERRLDGLVLLDLPDHDSTEAGHRLEVDRLVKVVDLLLWVVDPQKYADAALHDRYLRPLAGHAAVMVVVLNQVDALDADARDACAADLRKLLAQDGLATVPLLTTSARSGEGVDHLRALLATRVEARRAAALRLAADVDEVAARLARRCAQRRAARPPERSVRAELVDVLADAAGVPVVVAAVQRAHRRRAALATGWPPTRWLRRLRPDPLRRLHLDLPAADGGVSSLPPATPVQRARIDGALRDLAQASARELPEPWPGRVRALTHEAAVALPSQLDRAVTSVDLGTGRSPGWWAVMRALQALLLVVAACGALWLGVLFGIAWLRLPDPPVPEVRNIPVPTILLLGGLATGFLLAAASGAAARVGARRRGRTTRRRLVRNVAAVAGDIVLSPLQEELEAHDELCAALRVAARG
ncbi:MAG: GTPase [Actinomycetota bacterium]